MIFRRDSERKYKKMVFEIFKKRSEINMLMYVPDIGTAEVCEGPIFLERTGVIEVLLIGVDCNGDSAFNAKVSDPVEGVVS